RRPIDSHGNFPPDQSHYDVLLGWSELAVAAGAAPKRFAAVAGDAGRQGSRIAHLRSGRLGRLQEKIRRNSNFSSLGAGFRTTAHSVSKKYGKNSVQSSPATSGPDRLE